MLTHDAMQRQLQFAVHAIHMSLIWRNFLVQVGVYQRQMLAHCATIQVQDEVGSCLEDSNPVNHAPLLAAVIQQKCFEMEFKRVAQTQDISFAQPSVAVSHNVLPGTLLQNSSLSTALEMQKVWV